MKPLSILLLLCLCLQGYSQKYDGLWMMGFGGLTTTDTLYSITHLDFRSGATPSIFNEFKSITLLEGGSSICNKNGELQFYTNGFELRNSTDQLIANGSGLNPGQIADIFNTPGGSNPVLHGSMIIPQPDNDSVYYLFHVGAEYGTQNGGYYNFFYYSIVDMRLNNGLGAVTEKNHVLVNDSITGPMFNACKNANGRDWWIVMPEAENNCFYTYLLSPQGVDSVSRQCTGDTIHIATDRGMSCFTPDGSMYIWSNPYEHLNTLEFDRCNGTFGKHRRYLVLDSVQQATGNAIFDGVAVSPNSKYLYVATGTEVRQFDLTATNLLQSEVIVANTWSQTPKTTVCIGQSASDGKIYWTSTVQDTFLHVINYPDLHGLACSFVKNSVELPSYNHAYLPNYPHYRLGALAGSPCDSLAHVSEIEPTQANEIKLKLYPNPTTTSITIDYGFTDWSKGEVSLEITNQLGQTVYSQTLPAYSGFQKINIAAFAGGMYQVHVKRGAQTIAVSKFVKE